MEEQIKILAIESSCDETAAAVVVNGREVKSNVISSQIELHKLYGGVVPEIASRKHIEKINQVIEEALEEAGETLDSIDAVAVTYGPGLVGALLVGVAEAKAIAYAKKKPLVGVHHIEGHISANYIEHKDLEPPFMCLVASGGHSHLVKVIDYGKYEIIGRTRDDAAGEAFDKVARAIGLGYPGGPKIDKLAREGDKKAITFPQAKVNGAPNDFSFSGLKSAVLNYLNKCKMQNVEVNKADVAASFQESVVDVLSEHAINAALEHGLDKVAIAGGVASNSALRAKMAEKCEKHHLKFYYPSPVLCTDNAAMIGAAGYYDYKKGIRDGLDLNAVPNLKIGQR
ncbi:MAG: tRNA (adenosine(37)-N6)-threonylcarbamoyltransferase complex transferase subunit TsaD [Lachnospiraceae bacterium]|nr:tRNA (adenosine(37)-N6)-threonylcarbamoyltransferase complex transferase subunit TsaD [Lachnospiraceae bacterium]